MCAASPIGSSPAWLSQGIRLLIFKQFLYAFAEVKSRLWSRQVRQRRVKAEAQGYSIPQTQMALYGGEIVLSSEVLRRLSVEVHTAVEMFSCSLSMLFILNFLAHRHRNARPRHSLVLNKFLPIHCTLSPLYHHLLENVNLLDVFVFPICDLLATLGNAKPHRVIILGNVLLMFLTFRVFAHRHLNERPYRYLALGNDNLSISLRLRVCKYLVSMNHHPHGLAALGLMAVHDLGPLPIDDG